MLKDVADAKNDNSYDIEHHVKKLLTRNWKKILMTTFELEDGVG